MATLSSGKQFTCKNMRYWFCHIYLIAVLMRSASGTRQEISGEVLKQIK